MSILDGLFHRVEEWGTSSIRRRHFNSGGKDTMYEAIEDVIDAAGHQVYIAPVNAKRSASMRTRCTTAQRRGNVVLLSPALSAIPLALKENIPIFRELSEVELEKIEKSNDRVITHTVDVAWAKRQTLATSKGKIPIGDLVTERSCVFHSVGKDAGLWLTNALRSHDD